MEKVDPEILDRCLRRMQTGQATVDECLANNPGQAAALEPLLDLAATTRAQLSVQAPSQSFLAHSPMRVMNVVRASVKDPPPVRKPKVAWFGRPAFRLAGVLLAMVFLVGTTGVASASSDALPGDSLYGVKRGLERAALAISLSPEGDSELLLQQANRRISEVEELMQRGRGADIGPALEGYEQAVQGGLEIASEHGVSLEELQAALGKHEAVLEEVLSRAPQQAVPGLTNALEKSQHGKAVVEQIRSGQHPSDLAPGQQKDSDGETEGDSEQPPGQQNRDQNQGRDQAPGQLKKTQTPGSD